VCVRECVCMGPSEYRHRILKPVKVLKGAVDVACGGYHVAVVSKDGSLYTFGHNEFYQLGNGTVYPVKSPKRVQYLKGMCVCVCVRVCVLGLFFLYIAFRTVCALCILSIV